MSAREKTAVITLPDGDVLTYRKLSAKHLRQAAEAQLFAQADLVERIRGAQDRIAAAFSRPEAAAAAEPAPVSEDTKAPASVPEPMDPVTAYDKHTLVRLGTVKVNDSEMTLEQVALWADDLSVDDLTPAAEAILRLSDPRAFLSVVEREAERKNG